MKLRSVEALRGLAAVSVVLTHASSAVVAHPELGTGLLGGIEFPGCPAVEFFFVLSGFVMAVAHGVGGAPARFVWSRACRLYPMMWVTIGLLALYYGGTRTFPVSVWLSWMTLNPLQESDVVSVAWTLKLEIGFYALLTLAMLPRARWVVLAIWALATPVYASSAALQTALTPIGHGYVHRLISFSPTFLAGLAAGLAYRRHRMPPPVAMAAVVGGLAMVAARLPFDHWGYIYGPPISLYIYGVGFGGILLGLADLERDSVVQPGGWALLLGLASYPLYLSHLVVLDTWQGWMPAGTVPWVVPADLYVVVGLPLAGLVALALGVWVDRPLQRWLRHPVFPRHIIAGRSL